MPGIAELQPAQLQTGATAGLIDSQPPVNVSSLGKLPEFEDFMDAYRKGVITADDIRKRQIVGTTGHEAERAENIRRKTEAEQGTIDVSQLRPKQRELAQAQVEGATTQQTFANRLADPRPEVYQPAQEEFTQKFWDNAATQRFGTSKPTLEIPAPTKPEEFDDWVVRKVNSHPFPQGPEGDKARANYETNLRALGEKGEEYQTAVEDAKSRVRYLNPGDPEYHAELRRQTEKAMSHEELQKIQFETLREVGKAQAEAQAKSPERALAVGAKESEIRKEIASLDPIKELDKARPQYQQILLGEQKVNSRTPEEWRSDPQSARAMDLHLAFNYFKILHPDTRVTESNFKELKHLSPIDVGSAELADQMNNLLRGAYLDPTGRQKIIEEGKRAYQGYINAAKPIIQGYREHAARTGTDPDAITHPWNDVFKETPTTNPSEPLPGSTPRTAPNARPTLEEAGSAPTFQTPSQVPNTVRFFKTPNGSLKVNPNYRP